MKKSRKLLKIRYNKSSLHIETELLKIASFHSVFHYLHLFVLHYFIKQIWNKKIVAKSGIYHLLMHY